MTEIYKPTRLGNDIAPLVFPKIAMQNGELYMTRPAIVSPIQLPEVLWRRLQSTIEYIVNPFTGYRIPTILSYTKEAFDIALKLAVDVNQNSGGVLQLILPQNLYFGTMTNDNKLIYRLPSGILETHLWTVPTPTIGDLFQIDKDTGRPTCNVEISVRPVGSDKVRYFMLHYSSESKG